MCCRKAVYVPIKILCENKSYSVISSKENKIESKNLKRLIKAHWKFLKE